MDLVDNFGTRDATNLQIRHSNGRLTSNGRRCQDKGSIFIMERESSVCRFLFASTVWGEWDGRATRHALYLIST